MSIAIILLLLGGLVYLYIRNIQVYNFSQKVNNLCYDWNMDHITEMVEGKETSAYEWFYSELPHYNDMVLSFRPLKFKYWFSKDKLNKIFST